MTDAVSVERLVMLAAAAFTRVDTCAHCALIFILYAHSRL